MINEKINFYKSKVKRQQCLNQCQLFPWKRHNCFLFSAESGLSLASLQGLVYFKARFDRQWLIITN
jgi:hypothetical protein